MGTNFMDIAIVAVVGFSVFLGYRKGFLRTITGFVAIVLSLVLATTLHPYVAEFLKDSAIYDNVYEKTHSILYTPQEETDRLSDYGTGNLSLPRDFTDNMQKTIDSATDSVATRIAETVAIAAVNIFSMLLLFVGIRLLLLLLTCLAGLIVKLPLIGWSDGLLGALFGFLRGLVIVYLLLAVVAFSATVSPENKIAESIKHTEFAKVMYHHNVLLDFVYKK